MCVQDRSGRFVVSPPHPAVNLSILILGRFAFDGGGNPISITAIPAAGTWIAPVYSVELFQSQLLAARTAATASFDSRPPVGMAFAALSGISSDSVSLRFDCPMRRSVMTSHAFDKSRR
jgi:hypothetical protein